MELKKKQKNDKIRDIKLDNNWNPIGFSLNFDFNFIYIVIDEFNGLFILDSSSFAQN